MKRQKKGGPSRATKLGAVTRAGPDEDDYSGADRSRWVRNSSHIWEASTVIVKELSDSRNEAVVERVGVT